jgi:ABC-type ATPase with predicted acetyltransferase domain
MYQVERDGTWSCQLCGSSCPVNHRPTCPEVMTSASSPARTTSARARVIRRRYSSSGKSRSSG